MKIRVVIEGDLDQDQVNQEEENEEDTEAKLLAVRKEEADQKKIRIESTQRIKRRRSIKRNIDLHLTLNHDVRIS